MSSFTAVREQITVRESDRVLADFLCNELAIPPAMATILAARKFSDPDVCRRFFEPSLSHFHDPFLFSDMEKSVSRISDALSRKEKIAVYGDYDVDGISGTAMLVRVLRSLGATVDYHLPHRLTEGYGVSENGVRQIIETGANLMITVDCGITAVNEIGLAQRSGIDVIVTDHHEPKERLPRCYSILNPKVLGCGYPDKDLAGVGVVFKLCQAMGKMSGLDSDLWEPHLDLAALGTAADIVPLVGENRIIAKFGFEQMRRTRNAGLAALIDIQNLRDKRLTTSQIGFQLAPCINAAGRLGDPRRAVELLLTDDGGTAREYARELRNTNYERRAIDLNVWESACSWVRKYCDPEKDFALVLGNANWHAGVIGIVASKLVEKFHRPAILFSVGNDGMARGSGRSIPALHLLDALQECADLLETFGGHAAAAGMNLRSDSIGTFRSRFNDVVRSRITPDDLVPYVVADAEVTLSMLTPDFFSYIAMMEPFGPENIRPLLFCRNLKNRYPPRIVGSNHLKMTVTGDGSVMDAIGFNLGDRFEEVTNAPSMSLAFSLDENEWNGYKTLQMKIKGVAV